MPNDLREHDTSSVEDKPLIYQCFPLVAAGVFDILATSAI